MRFSGVRFIMAQIVLVKINCSFPCLPGRGTGTILNILTISSISSGNFEICFEHFVQPLKKSRKKILDRNLFHFDVTTNKISLDFAVRDNSLYSWLLGTPKWREIRL